MSSRTTLFGAACRCVRHMLALVPSSLLSCFSSTTSSTRILKAYYDGTLSSTESPGKRLPPLSMDNYTENSTKLTAKLYGFVRFDSQSFLTFGKFAIKNVNQICFPPLSLEKSIFSSCFFVASSTNWHSFTLKEVLFHLRKWACRKTRSRFLVSTLEFYEPLVNAAAPRVASRLLSRLCGIASYVLRFLLTLVVTLSSEVLSREQGLFITRRSAKQYLKVFRRLTPTAQVCFILF